MRIILTHEQTDFDGIASLLGAHLIDRNAIPVLPRRLNRNVHAFVAIYGADLPFVDPRDLEDGVIEKVYLVDTQSMVSIRGIQENTPIYVVDHHSKRDDLPPGWDVTISETGANVTLFVEQIIDQDIHLGIVEATLLLLGIYEDTGSLTYSRTTPRDVYAAGCLLEHGANLSIVGDYLNHPLSSQQQKLYDELRSSAKSYSIHGHNILIAPGDARGMDEELSTIAHKLRDLIDPDAIILLIQIHGGVQLIARSAKDDIDVAKIANHFGGGGHQRAAAALIKSDNKEDIYTHLLSILPEYIQPAITVNEIMSKAPQLITPGTPVLEIARKMQRYGYEGYPVVKEGEIIGLVTRRAVDRALNHKLNLTAESLMDAGNVSISPDSSIERLQSMMVSTGWGQIPVINSDGSEIIGIVTRTDLLETLAPSRTQNSKLECADTLERMLPSYRFELLKAIAKIAVNHQAALYIVGGFVRDLLLGYPSLDFDLVVEGDAISLAEAVKEKYGGKITTHKKFGTAKWVLENIEFPGIDKCKDESEHDEKLPATLDFITARREFYIEPTALPVVETGSIKLDLHRRDFTINTMALRLDGVHYGKLLDYWGGYSDLRSGLIRVLHSLSFVDDPTRMLRAVRYEQRYGFRIGDRTLQLLVEARSLLEKVSGDRIRHEINNIIEEDSYVAVFKRLNELDLLKSIHPCLIWDDWLARMFSNIKNPRPEWGIKSQIKEIPIKNILVYAMWLIRHSRTDIETILQRLKLPQIIKVIIRDAKQLWEDQSKLHHMNPSWVTRYLDKIHKMAIYVLYSSTDSSEFNRILFSYITDWKDIKATITGNDLSARGLKPGPQFSIILQELRDAWVDGRVNTKEEEVDLLDNLILKYYSNENQNEG
jgi:tRNA nucleotidyltransferase (CCA-adding enzyme)